MDLSALSIKNRGGKNYHPRKWGKDFLLLAIFGTAGGFALLVLLIAFVWGASPVLIELPWFNPMLFIAISLTSLIITFHTLGRASVLYDCFSYWVGIGFAVSSIALAFYVLAWPGLLPDGRSFIAKLANTAGLISTLAPTLLVSFILVGVFARWPSGQMLTRHFWMGSLIFSAAATIVIHILIIVFEENLPVMVRPNGTFTATLMVWNLVNGFLLAAGSILATRRYMQTGDALFAYVVFPQLAVLFTQLVLVIGGKRYDLWWYTARIAMMAGYLVVLLGLMAEYIRLFRRENEGRLMLDAILENIPIGMVVAGGPPDYPLLRASRHGIELNQRPAEDLIGMPTGQHQAAWKIYSWVNDGLSSQPEQTPLFRASRLGEEIRNQEFVMEALDGRKVPVLVNAGPIRDTQGQIVAAVSAWLDITEIKQAELALQKYTLELERANRDLRYFAIVAVHDLQEPLRKIQILCDSIQDGTNNLTERQVDRIARIQVSAQQMRNLIDGLHRFAFITTHHQPFQPVDLNQIAHGILLKLQPKIQQAGGIIEIESLPVIEADPEQIEMLFLHLIENGLKFQPQEARPHIKIRAEQSDTTRVQIQVEDNGIGFDEVHAAHLFEPFERLLGKTQDQYEGTGIGLTICRWIVERHGGEISAQSQPGRGTTFTISLPIHQTQKT